VAGGDVTTRPHRQANNMHMYLSVSTYICVCTLYLCELVWVLPFLKKHQRMKELNTPTCLAYE
jgi:hypothetical protein